MRASDIMFFVLCFNIAAPLVAATGIFGAGPAGAAALGGYFVWGAAAAALAAGGVSVMGFSFKIPAVITVFGAMYGASVALMGTLLYQLSIPVLIVGAITSISAVVGIVGIIQIAGGAHGPME